MDNSNPPHRRKNLIGAIMNAFMAVLALLLLLGKALGCQDSLRTVWWMGVVAAISSLVFAVSQATRTMRT